MKEHYSILVEGDGRGNYPTRIVDVYCTEDELQIIGKAMTSYVWNFTKGGCCCIAKKGRGVSHNDCDYVFSDCM